MLLSQLLLLIFLLTIVEGKNYRLIIDDEWKDCPGYKPVRNFFDYSNFTITRPDDEIVVLSGKLIPLVSFRQPLSINVKSEHSDKGSWSPGMLNFVHLNICDELKRTDRSWSKAYAPFKKCPATKGVAIDFGKETDYSVVLKDAPDIPLGQWKLYVTLNNIAPDPKTLCVLVQFELLEIS